MFIIDTIKRAVGYVEVEQIDRPGNYPIIRVVGIRGDFLAKDIGRYYRTSKVATAVFDKITKNSVTLPAFFALEFAKYLEDVISERNHTYVPRRSAKAILDGLKTATWLKKTTEEVPSRLDYSKLSNFYYEPKPYQRTWLEKFEKVGYQFTLNGSILDAAPGSGKTLSSLFLVECSDADVVIIISPQNALRRVWVNTLETGMKKAPTWWCSDKGGVPGNEKYLIFHYEKLAEAVAHLTKLKGKKIAIIVDESHHFNNEKSGRTQLLIELCNKSESNTIVLQSGTPFKAVGAEIVPALFCIDPTFNDELASRFRKIYAASADKALELLMHRLGMISHKVTKAELGLQSPVITNIGVTFDGAEKYTLTEVAKEMKKFIEERTSYYKARQKDDESYYLSVLEKHEKTLRGPQMSDYKQYLQDVKIIRKSDLRSIGEIIQRANSYENRVIIPGLQQGEVARFKEAKTIYKYVVLKIQGECLGQVLGRKRMECSVAISKNFDYEKYIESTTKKTLIYTIYVQALESAVQRLKDIEYQPLAVYGETNKNLASIVEMFEKKAELNPLVATFHSLSTAVPLTMADVMVMLDVPWRDYILQQTISRVSRLGADTQPRIFICNLVTGEEPNLSTRTVDILRWSQQQLVKITGHESPYALDDKAITVEAYSMLNKPLDLMTDDLESRFLARLA